eukprot:5952525-Heterocapsa_arctica.AAC.1
MPSNDLLRHHPNHVLLGVRVVGKHINRQEEVVTLLHERKPKMSTFTNRRLILAAKVDVEPMTGERRNAQQWSSYIHDIEVAGKHTPTNAHANLLRALDRDHLAIAR